MTLINEIRLLIVAATLLLVIIMKWWIFFVGILALYSCGRGKFPDYEPKDEIIEISVEHQFFKANFIPLNRQESSFRKAQALLWLKLRQFYVRIVFWGKGKRRYHQFIHAGDRCPDNNSDLNKDGMINFYETIMASGEILIPLDRNLQTSRAGSDWYPFSGSNGSYLYSRSSSLLEMLPDLGYSSVQSLDLSNRVIIIYGSSAGPLIPIACAKISKEN